MALLIGVDLGTTGCKAAGYDERGMALGESYLEYGLITLQPRWSSRIRTPGGT